MSLYISYPKISGTLSLRLVSATWSGIGVQTFEGKTTESNRYVERGDFVQRNTQKPFIREGRFHSPISRCINCYQHLRPSLFMACEPCEPQRKLMYLRFLGAEPLTSVRLCRFVLKDGRPAT